MKQLLKEGGGKRWIHVRQLKGWWKKYTLLEEEDMMKALEELKAENKLSSKREDRMWRRAHQDPKPKGGEGGGGASVAEKPKGKEKEKEKVKEEVKEKEKGKEKGK
jgi:hypothetical protein